MLYVDPASSQISEPDQARCVSGPRTLDAALVQRNICAATYCTFGTAELGRLECGVWRERGLQIPRLVFRTVPASRGPHPTFLFQA